MLRGHQRHPPLAAVHLEKVDLVVLTIDDQPAILGATTLIRSLAPRTMIVARARDLAASKVLLRAGANKAFPEAVEASLTLAAEVLISIGVTAKDTELFLRGVRNSDYTLVRDAVEVASADRTTAPKLPQ